MYRAAFPQQVQCAYAKTTQYFDQNTFSDMQSTSKNVQLIPGVGVRLKPKDTLTTTVLNGETAALAGAVAGGFQLRNINRAHTEITGSGSGVSDLADSSGPMWERVQSSTDDLSDATFRLQDDMDAFPGPGYAENIQMDRVFVSSVFDWLEHHIFTWIVDVEAHSRVGTIPILRGYFLGRAGSEVDFTGMGQYCAVCYNNGTCMVYERGYTPGAMGTKFWRLRQQFNSRASKEAGSRWALRVQSTKEGFIISWGSMAVQLAKTQPSGGYLAVPNRSAQQIPLLAVVMDGHKFVPSVLAAQPPTVSSAIRLDLSRPFKTSFQVIKHGYETNGRFRTRQFIVNKPHWGKPIRIEVYGNIPDDTDVIIHLFNADGTERASTASGTITGALEDGRYAEFDPSTPDEGETFYVEYELTGDGDHTPTLRFDRHFRDGHFEDDYPLAFELNPVVRNGQRLSILTGGSNPIDDSASWQHIDLTGALDPIKDVGIFGVRIETEWDPEDPLKRCVLFGGICEYKPRKRRHTRPKMGLSQTGADYPTPVGYEYEFIAGPCTMPGSAQRAVNFTISFDTESGALAKATNVIRTLLNLSGWKLTQISIPDRDIQVFPVRDKEDLTVTPDTDMVALAVELARMYLGAALFFDWNAGDEGEWKLLEIPSAPYANKAVFVTRSQTDKEVDDETFKRIFSLGSYDPEEEGGLAGVPVVPILDMQIHDRRPEANEILMIGGTADNGQQITQRYVNPKSYRIHPDQVIEEDELEDPDWTGFPIPLVIRNSALQTQGSVNFYLGRYEQQLAHGYKQIYIGAPLLLIPHEDDAERRRPLRFGDPVYVIDNATGDEYQCIVRGCSPGYSSDSMQLAIYELETVRDL